VDVSVLKKLIGSSDEVAILKLLKRFQISAEKIAMELKTACADCQAMQAREQAHKLKSSARTVGALALGELCEKMEYTAKAGNTEALTALLPAFEQEFEAVNVFLNSL
jgi:two-component system sensor histidine kinase/response regulator